MDGDLGRQVPALIAVFKLAGTAVTLQRDTKVIGLTLEDRSQKIPIILSLDAHRHDDGVDPRLLEIGVEEAFEPSVPFVEDCLSCGRGNCRRDRRGQSRSRRPS